MMQSEIPGNLSSDDARASAIPTKRPVPQEITSNLRSWKHMALYLRIIFIFLGCTGTISGLLATAFSGENNSGLTRFFTVSATASIGLLTAFDIGGKANAVRRAWRNLNAAVLLYQEDPEFTMKHLIAEFRRGEDIIGDVNYIPQKVDTEGQKQQDQADLSKDSKDGKRRDNKIKRGSKAASKANGNGASAPREHQSPGLGAPAKPTPAADDEGRR